MLSLQDLVGFVTVSLVMIISPGPNIVLITQTSTIDGPRAAVFNTLGIMTAVLLHALASGLGLSLIVSNSPLLYNAIKLAGAAFLIYLGGASLWSSYHLRRKAALPDQAADIAMTAATRARASFVKGFVTNILNGGTIFIFLSLFPQFIKSHENILYEWFVLTVVYLIVQAAWYSFFILALTRLRQHLFKLKVQIGIKSATGALLIILGLRIALRGQL